MSHLSIGSIDYQNRGVSRRVADLLPARQTLLPSQYQIGIDIWEGNGAIDWQALEEGGVTFAFVRLNNMAGGHHMDTRFNTNMAARTSIIRIPYFVYNPWVDGPKNYDWLAANLPVGTKAVMSDIEVKYAGYAAATYAKEVERYLSLVRARWHNVTYTAEWFLPSLSYWDKGDYCWAQYPTALYQSMTITWDRMRELLKPFTGPSNANKCPGPVKFWQCSGDRIILPGSPRVMDVQVAFMTLDELKQFAGVTEPEPPPGDDDMITPEQWNALLSEIRGIKASIDNVASKITGGTTPPPVEPPPPATGDGYTGPILGTYKILDLPDMQTGNAITTIQDSYGNEITVVMDKMVSWMEANCPGWANFVKNGSVTKGPDGLWRYEVKLIKGQLVRIAEVGGKTKDNPLGNGRIVGMDSESIGSRCAVNMDEVSPTKTPYYFHKITGQPWYFPIIQPRQQKQMTVPNSWWVPMKWLEKVG